MLRRLLSIFSLATLSRALIVDCSQGNSVFQFTALGLDPEPPIAGQPVLMTVQFENPGPEITDGTVTNQITLNGLPLSPSTEALCTNTQCPIVTGFNDRSAKSDWPTGIAGKLVSHIEWTAVDGTQLLCIEITERMSAGQRLRGHATEEESAPVSCDGPLWNCSTLWNMFQNASEIGSNRQAMLDSLYESLTNPSTWKEWFLNALNRTNRTNATDTPVWP